ncbi:MAG: Asp-tRNA(Asn)/Glu-tRNA(Gln) amidotransferase subunit GatC [Ferruginibacter sp.]
MEINNEMISRLAKLSRLSFNDEEKEAIKADLQNMIGFVDKLHEVDTGNVEPLLHIIPHQNIYREDRIEGHISNQEALHNAPVHDEHFFKVPKVITK